MHRPDRRRVPAADHPGPELPGRVRRQRQRLLLALRDPERLLGAVPVDLGPVRDVMKQCRVEGRDVVGRDLQRLLNYLVRGRGGGREKVERVRLGEDHDVVEGVVVCGDVEEVRVAFAADVGERDVGAEGGVLDCVVFLRDVAFGVDCGEVGMGRPGIEGFFEAGDDDAEFPWRGRGEGREEEGESDGDHCE